MQKTLLDILKCPYCDGSQFELNTTEEELERIITGTIHCTKCNNEIKIVNGVVDILGANCE